MHTTAEFAFEYCKYCSTDYKNSDGKAYSLMLMQQVDSVGGDYFVTMRYFDVSTGDSGHKHRRALVLRWWFPPALLIGKALV